MRPNRGQTEGEDHSSRTYPLGGNPSCGSEAQREALVRSDPSQAEFPTTSVCLSGWVKPCDDVRNEQDARVKAGNNFSFTSVLLISAFLPLG